MFPRIIFLAFFLLSIHFTEAQQQLGINTMDPQRTLHVAGSGNQHIRIHNSSALFTSEAGIEFLTGDNNTSAVDWRIVNDGGVFKIRYGDDNFSGASTEAIRINAQHTGIGSVSPNAKLNIDGGSLITFGGHGYMKVGSVNGYNLAFDNTQIVAYNNYAPATLNLQANGGHTHFGLNGGNTYMAMGGGGVGVGTTTIDASLSIVDDNFQFHINNDSDDANDWHIGASHDGWQAGDNQLLFSPTGSSGDAVLRLMDVEENDGTNAPVMIHSTADHTILMDGNEIDTRGTSLYINHNSDEETYINPTGGRVGIGTNNPQAMLHVYAASGNILTLENGGATWHFNPQTAGDGDLLIYWEGMNSALATVDGVTGQWTNISDREAKENIEPLEDILDRLLQLNTYHYTFRHDSAHQVMTGVIAQEAMSLFPEIVRKNEDQYGVSYSQLAAIGIKAIQEQQAIIETLKEKVALLKSKLVEPEDVLHTDMPMKSKTP